MIYESCESSSKEDYPGLGVGRKGERGGKKGSEGRKGEGHYGLIEMSWSSFPYSHTLLE